MKHATDPDIIELKQDILFSYESDYGKWRLIRAMKSLLKDYKKQGKGRLMSQVEKMKL